MAWRPPICGCLVIPHSWPSLYFLLRRGQVAIVLAQAFLDLGTCFLVAWLASRLVPQPYRLARRARCAVAGGHLSFRSELRGCAAARGAGDLPDRRRTHPAGRRLHARSKDMQDARRTFPMEHPLEHVVSGGFLVGLATLVRPESPLLLAALALVLWCAGGAAPTGASLSASERSLRRAPAAAGALGSAQLGAISPGAVPVAALCSFAGRIHAARPVRLDGHLAGAFSRRLSGALEYRHAIASRSAMFSPAAFDSPVRARPRGGAAGPVQRYAAHDPGGRSGLRRTRLASAPRATRCEPISSCR